MIITRYLFKEICNMVAAATVILLMIFLCTQFIHYLTAAAGGKYTSLFLLRLMLLQIPFLLGLLLPLGFFVAILLAYGRLHMDREMMVLSSCGMSSMMLFRITMTMALGVTVAVAFLSLWLSPYVNAEQKRLMAEAKVTPILETVFPGRFFALNGGKSVFYVENVSRDHQSFNRIFFAELTKPSGNELGKDNNNKDVWSIVTANKGLQVDKMGKKDDYLQINQGSRYTGHPGEPNFHIEQFDKLKIKIAHKIPVLTQEFQGMSTRELWQKRNEGSGFLAELHWRMAVPISVLLLTLFAIPMSKINPRQGKYAQLIPAIIVYVLYANMTFVGRDWIENETIPAFLGLWWLHGTFLLLALGVWFWQPFTRALFRKKPRRYSQKSLVVEDPN